MTVTAEQLAMLESTVVDPTARISRLAALIYGNRGTGKTVFSMLVAQKITPPDKTIVHIDTSDGWVSMLNHKNLAKRTIPVRYEGLNGVMVLAEAIRQGHGRFANVGTVVWDELSTSANDCLQSVAVMRERNYEAKNQTNPLMDGQTDQSDYLFASNLVIRPYKALLSIPGLNLIVVAHERKDGGDTAIKQIGPDFWNDLRGKITAPQQLMARFVGKQQGGNYVRTIQVHPTATVNCKSRIGGLDVENAPGVLATKIEDWLKNGATEEDQTHVIKTQDADTEFPGIKVEN